jgi:hypothetical protein
MTGVTESEDWSRVSSLRTTSFVLQQSGLSVVAVVLEVGSKDRR